MISYIKGELAEVAAGKVIVDVGGIGYLIFMSNESISLLGTVGEEVKIHTYLNVKEDAMQLFGFLTRDDLEIFRLLIAVSGIGPKGGLSILSVLSPDDLRFAVISKDVKAISAAPGIGRKTAEKLIIELADKVRLEDTLTTDEPALDNITGAAGDVISEAVQALVALGYGNTEAMRAVKKVPLAADTTVEEVLKQSLKFIMA